MVVAQLGRLVPTCANLGCFNRFQHFQLFVPHFVWEGHLTGSTSQQSRPSSRLKWFNLGSCGCVFILGTWTIAARLGHVGRRCETDCFHFKIHLWIYKIHQNSLTFYEQAWVSDKRSWKIRWCSSKSKIPRIGKMIQLEEDDDDNERPWRWLRLLSSLPAGVFSSAT